MSNNGVEININHKAIENLVIVLQVQCNDMLNIKKDLISQNNILSEELRGNSKDAFNIIGNEIGTMLQKRIDELSALIDLIVESNNLSLSVDAVLANQMKVE